MGSFLMDKECTRKMVCECDAYTFEPCEVVLIGIVDFIIIRNSSSERISIVEGIVAKGNVVHLMLYPTVQVPTTGIRLLFSLRCGTHATHLPLFTTE